MTPRLDNTPPHLPPQKGRDLDLSPANEQELVDYEGMLVSGAAAQRRGWV